MVTSADAAGGANLTITEAGLRECKPIGSGRHLRAFCPFHGSDHQRSLSVNTETGHFKCYACGAWGYTEDARARRRGTPGGASRRETRAARPPVPLPVSPAPVRDDLEELVARYAAALPGSPGERYLELRRIPFDLVRDHRLGFAPRGDWANPGARGRAAGAWEHGRVVVPHTAPDGTALNLYSRAVELGTAAPKDLRHDHLPGNKGFFNGVALHSTRAWVCEGPFDALSLLAAGVPAACAIFGVDGWRWEWARAVRDLVFAFDRDGAGARWKEIARGARLRGISVGALGEEAYGGKKDVAEAWQARVLRLPADDYDFAERAALLEHEAGVPRAEADRRAREERES